MSKPISTLSAAENAPDLALLPATAAGAHPDTPLFADDDWPEQPAPVHTIGTFWAAVDRLAARLWAAGVRPRQHIAVILENHPRIQLAAFAAHRIGAIPALLSAAMPTAHLVACLDTLHPGWTLLDSGLLQRADADADVVSRIGQRSRSLWYPAADAADPRRPWLSSLPEPGDYEVGQVRPDEVALITHTSGTTAVPKLCAHSTNSIYQHAAPQVRLIREFGSDRLAVKSLSCVHARATSALITALMVGQPLCFVTDERPVSVARLLTRLRPQSLEAHPNTYIKWEEIARTADRPMASVARYSSTFDAIHPRTVRAMLSGSDISDAFFLQAYGQTETGPIAARPMTLNDPLELNTRVVGAPVEGRGARIVNDRGEPAEPGTPGFIECRAVSQMLGYVGGATLPAEGGWWRMGDWGRLRADGSIELLDRVIDVIPGVDSTLALEDSLLDSFAELQEVVVLPAESAGECRVVAVAKPGTEIDTEPLRKSAEKLGIALDDVIVLEESELPTTGSKKVRRAALLEMLRHGR